MPGGSRRPPWWGVVGTALLVVVVAALLTLDRVRVPSPAAAGAGTAQTQPLRVALLGDSYTAGSAMDSGRQARWPALVADEYGWEPLNFAVGGTGYTNPGNSGERFIDRVPDIVAADPDAVIVIGGANDARGDPDIVRAAVRDVLEELRSQLPEAKLVVLSSFWRAAPPPQVSRVSVVLREEAAAVDAPFIDVSDLFADGRGIGEDGVHPTDAGHRRIAEFLGPRLTDVL